MFSSILQQSSVIYGVFAAGLGVIVHSALKKGEWHKEAPLLFRIHGYLGLALTVGYLSSSSMQYVFKAAMGMFLVYLTSLLGNVAIYRLYFSPLARMRLPGPKMAALSKLWHVFHCRGSQNHLVLAKMKDQYGDFVRTGPSELTVFHPDAMRVIDGPQTTCIKSEWYDILHPEVSLVTARDKSVHGARRRQWKQGFSTQAVYHYEQKIFQYLEILDSSLMQDANAGVATEVRTTLNWFSFDLAGDVVFNKRFGMMESRKDHHIVRRLQRALSLLGPLGPAPWLAQIGLKCVPPVWVLKDWFETLAWCRSEMQKRINHADGKELEPDLSHFLMEKKGSDHVVDKESLPWLEGDTLLSIVAGSEPTAFTLLGVFTELAKNPKHIEILLKEFSTVDIRDMRALSKLSHLNGAINESMRLYPALLTGGSRKTTSEGVFIGDTFIPPNITVVAPRFSISRREDCFERANEFIPERWYKDNYKAHNPVAFSPFGTGNHSCVGRFLAMDIMRPVLARIITKYHFELAPGEDASRVEADLKDHFIPRPGDLQLRFSLR